MSGEVRGDPAALERYTDTVTPALEAVAPLLQEYGAAVSAYNSASPNDLGSSTPDHGGRLDAVAGALRSVDQIPGAFAYALRAVDQFGDHGGGAALIGRAGNLEARLEALTAARLELPDGEQGAVMDAAAARLQQGVVWPWDDGVVPWLWGSVSSPQFVAGGVIGFGTGLVSSAAKPTQQRGLVVPVRDHWNRGKWMPPSHRWRPGWASRMNRIAPAGTVARWGPRIGRIGGAAGLVLAGAGQVVEDWNDPSLTTGDRIARTTVTTVAEGGGGVVAGMAGAAIGQTLIPIPVVGAVIGGAIGGWIGGEIGGIVNDNMEGVTEAFGEGIDDAIDVGGDLVEDIGGWFD